MSSSKDFCVRWKIKRGLWKLYFHTFRLLKVDNAPSIYKIKFKKNYNDSTFKYYLTGKYGPGYYDHILKVREPFCYIDIGANQGLYTLAAAKNPNLIHAYSFEPVPTIARMLEQNIDLNKASALVSVFNVGIARSPRSVVFGYNKDHSGAATKIDEANCRFEKVNVDLVDRRYLDQLAMPLDTNIHVKVDVEGLEKEVIEQLLASRWGSQIREIFFECSVLREDPKEVESLLSDFGFELIPYGSGLHYDVLAVRDRS